MKLLIIDTFYFLHRSFHAFPIEMKTSDGERTNAIFGFSQAMLNAILHFNPTHVVCAWESEDQPSFRKELYPKYQINRKSSDPEEEMIFRDQIPKVAEMLETFKIPRVFESGFEGDDIIGTIAKNAVKGNPGTEVVIYTADKDMLQLVGNGISVFRPSAPPFVKSRLIDKDEFIREFGFDSSFMVDYKALRGDPSDNIPGVSGIGDKTAKSLVQTYGDLESIYSHIDDIDKLSVKNKLLKDKDNAFLSKQLSTIITNIPIAFDFERAGIGEFDVDAGSKVFEKYQFNSLMDRLSSLRHLQLNAIPDISTFV